MLSSLGGAGLRIAGWSFLPDFAAKRLIYFYHQSLRSRGTIPPKPNSVDYIKTYRLFYAFTILSYLVYNFVDAARSTPPNFFEILGLGPEADETSIRSAYRVFAKRYHPDRAGPDSEDMFMAVRDAYEALKDPVKRFAYERFGQDALHWKDCSEPRDYIWHGIMKASGFYVVSVAILLAMSVFMNRSRVAFWRYMLLLGLLASELYFVAGPRSYGILELLFPRRVAFQHVSFFHQIFVFMSVAISRVIPVLFPSPPAQDDPARVKMLTGMLRKVAAQTTAEATQMMQSHLLASGCVAENKGSQEPDVQQQKELLYKEMENILIERRIRMEPPLQPLWDAAVRRRREVIAATAALASDPDEHNAPRLPRLELMSETVPERQLPLNIQVRQPPSPVDGSKSQTTQSFSVTETVLTDEGPRQRNSSTRSSVRVLTSSSDDER